MSHSRRGISVYSEAKGWTFTSKRGAQRLIDRDLANYSPDGLVLIMVETDHRFDSRAADQVHHSPNFQTIRFTSFHSSSKVLIPHGFLHYPQPGSFRRRRPPSPQELFNS